MAVRSQEEVIVLTMVLSAEECLELHRETGAYVRFIYLFLLAVEGRTVRIVNSGRGCGTTTPMRTSRDIYDMRDCTEITLHSVEL